MTVPVKSETRPLMQRASVVLPEPLSPTIARHSPSLTANETPCRTCRCPYRAEMSVTASAAESAALADPLTASRGGRMLTSTRSEARKHANCVPGPDVGRPGHVQAPLGSHRAARPERTASRSPADPRRMARDSLDRRLLVGPGRGEQQAAGVGVKGRGQHVAGGAELDHPARVHHRDLVGDLGDDGQVMRDVDRRDAVVLAQPLDRVEDPALGGHVQSGGRLVEHDQVGLRRERHRQRDALLLAAGELVRVGVQDLRPGLQAYVRQDAVDQVVGRQGGRRPPRGAGGGYASPGSAPWPGPGERRRPCGPGARAARRERPSPGRRR